MRLKDSNDQFFKNSSEKNRETENEKDRVWLNLATDRGGFNQLLIGFIEGASERIDPGYDAIKFQGSNKISFYSVVEDKKTAIQGLGPFHSNKEITLGFDTQVANRKFIISIAQTEGILRDVNLILFDRALGISHDLKKAPYVFYQSEKGNFKNRFTLSFEKQADLLVDSSMKSDEFLVYNHGDIFTINSSKTIEMVRLYDILGRMVYESHPRSNIFDITASNTKKGQVLLLDVIHEDQSRFQKKVYKQ